MVGLSIVATLYKSELHLREFYERVTRAAAAVTDDFELVLVNDGSPDGSLDVAVELYRRDPRVRVVDLSRNFGHHKAMMTGLGHARGELVFLIDSDLEEDPELLTDFVRRLDETGADVVYGVQGTRRGGLAERWTGQLYFWFFNLISDVQIPENLSTIRLMTRRYVDALLQHREREMMIAGLWALTGFRQEPVRLQKHARSATTYSLRHKIRILVNSITSFSHRPLLGIFYLGLVIIALASIAAGYLVVRRLFFGELLAGWPSLIVSVWLLGGLTLFSVGILGIYLSKVFIETKQRPYTIIRELYEQPATDQRASQNPGRGRRVLF
jgi:putative glycosyltransferase